MVQNSADDIAVEHRCKTLGGRPLRKRRIFFVASILEEVGLRPEVHLLTDRAGTLESTMCQPGVRELWNQEAVREHRLEVFYVPGQINVADALTKALPRERFEQLMSVLGVRGSSSPVRE